jgi:hypothetical protein
MPSAIQDAKKAIDAAIAAVTSIGPFEHNIQTHAVGRAFQSAENKIQECFKQYGVWQSSLIAYVSACPASLTDISCEAYERVGYSEEDRSRC